MKNMGVGGRRNTFGLAGNSQMIPPGSASVAFRSSQASSVMSKPSAQMREHLKTPGTPINHPMGIAHGSQIIGVKRSIVLPDTTPVDQEESFSTAPLNNGKAIYVQPKIAILTKT